MAVQILYKKFLLKIVILLMWLLKKLSLIGEEYIFSTDLSAIFSLYIMSQHGNFEFYISVMFTKPLEL